MSMLYRAVGVPKSEVVQGKGVSGSTKASSKRRKGMRVPSKLTRDILTFFSSDEE